MRRNTRHSRNGLALVIVLTVVGVASLIGLVMLSSSALQADIAHNTAQSATADYMAESAIQTASYYLQRNFANMPASWSTTSGYAIFAQNVTVSGMSGSFDVDATATTNPDEYQVYALGRSSGSSPTTKSASAKVKVLRVTPTYVTGSGGTLLIGTNNNFAGGAAVIGNGTITNNSGNILSGGSRTSFQSNEFALPTTSAGINYYGGNITGGTYTTPSGQIGTPQVLATGTIASAAALSANSSNPGKVFYYPGDVVITGAGTYTGTIIARGKIQLKAGLNSSLTFNRVAGFPAMIADNSLYINSKGLTCNINGVVWVGGGTTFNGGSFVTGTGVRINGALLIAAGQSLANISQGSLLVTYTPANVDILNLTTAVQPATGIKLSNWSQ